MEKSIVLASLLILLSYMFEEATSAGCASNSETITLPQGTIKGSYDWFNNQRTFLGIPYASVTERFQDPGSPPSWNGTLTANSGNVMCNQYVKTLETPVGQEDCLVLNVYTPPSLEQQPFPVMVFIHGGGFYSGSNSELIYNPKFLVNKKVIVVTINYRLGAFGFLCLGLQEAPGNVGLKDQIAALKWVQNNIACFGESFLRDATRALYDYYFKVDSFRNLNKFLTRLPTKPGACHGDELFYIFQPVVYSLLPPTWNDAATIEAMTTFWTNFAKTGIPSNSRVSWRSSAEQLEFLEIDKEIKMRTLPNEDRMKFWRDAFEKYGRK
ncbi:hypothetical protein PYW07_002179 [Mythimna separata]|uniref:Carboxylesterase type B domain-containing protein n=1 Tax=Mythimna separata TaxID=271217 RepID=A0AAD8DU45_MYTSE|nr:hypothetical protein PYW07_002179 [Mythimna separata]